MEEKNLINELISDDLENEEIKEEKILQKNKWNLKFWDKKIKEEIVDETRDNILKSDIYNEEQEERFLTGLFTISFSLTITFLIATLTFTASVLYNSYASGIEVAKAYYIIAFAIFLPLALIFLGIAIYGFTKKRSATRARKEKYYSEEEKKRQDLIIQFNEDLEIKKEEALKEHLNNLKSEKEKTLEGIEKDFERIFNKIKKEE